MCKHAQTDIVPKKLIILQLVRLILHSVFRYCYFCNKVIQTCMYVYVYVLDMLAGYIIRLFFLRTLAEDICLAALLRPEL